MEALDLEDGDDARHRAQGGSRPLRLGCVEGGQASPGDQVIRPSRSMVMPSGASTRLNVSGSRLGSVARTSWRYLPPAVAAVSGDEVIAGASLIVTETE